MLAATACGDSFTSAEPTGGASGTGGTGGASSQCLDPYPAPPGGNCPSQCTRCVANECEIRCESGSPCSGQSRQCPAGFNCAVFCIGAGPCAAATIECPEHEECRVACSGAGACVDLTVECGNGPCTLSCGESATAPDACANATINCGVERCQTECSDAIDQAPTMLDCDTSCQCIDGC